MAVSLIVLLYVTARIGHDLAGTAGSVALIGVYLGIEAILFWSTRRRA
ncbi:MAG: hypothetical protein HOP95_11460, partial [Sphingomonas sp.]|nr:hypothetical protein [Sphingomonas sp.]